MYNGNGDGIGYPLEWIERLQIGANHFSILDYMRSNINISISINIDIDINVMVAVTMTNGGEVAIDGMIDVDIPCEIDRF